mgnify:CR=1 FL=1
MSIERNEGGFGYTAYCDFCSNDLDCGEVETFQEAVDVVKEDGWKIAKIKDGWTHKCGVCQLKEAE